MVIIPARGGSKRIPKKNIKEFLGRPIIEYPIETALKAGFEVIVSTDCPEIARVSKRSGAVIHYRSQENSDDYATLTDVVLEVLGEYWNNLVCCLLPTAVFITPKLLREGYDKAPCMTVSEFDYPIWRALDDKGMIWPEYMNSRSQDLPKAYHDAGQFYWCKSKEIKDTLFSTKHLVINSIDIDTEQDWKLAELLYENQIHQFSNSHHRV